MTRHHIHSLVAALLVCAGWALVSQPTRAGDPAGEMRFFLELLPPDSPNPGHDFEAAGSRRIVSHYNGDTSGIDFTSSGYASDRTIFDADGNAVLDIGETKWVLSPVLHITDAGVESVQSIYWLVDYEDDAKTLRRLLTGTTSATGPDGDVVTLPDVFALDDGSGLLKVSKSPSGALHRLRVSVGWFQK